MRIIEKIPRIWKIAYLLICAWYAINYTIGSIMKWQILQPYNNAVLWNGFYLFEAICILIALTFIYSNWLFKFRLPFQVAGHMCGLVVYFMIISYFSYYFDYYLDGRVYLDDWKEYMQDLLSFEAMRFYDQYLITVAVYYVIRYFESLQRKDQEKSELALKNKEMELSLLKSQINPHFLFNTLNSISTLISSNKEKARKVITQLSDVFRYALDSHSGQNVRLIHELDFIENYLKIQQVRFGERLRYVTDVESTCLSVEIPPMVLQPLVENSVKYGIGPKEDGGTIWMIVKRTEFGIYFEITDDGLGINAKKVLDGKSSGVGLKNSDKRLQSTFGKSACLHINAGKYGYSVSFTLPSNWEEVRDKQRKLEAV
ncbi:histidine kinase [Fulvivirga maritima]|uniref:sensor histidine kinase n=1 Tax=Fulvivirga maritima TaxID=2904247 RepID=UPI001F3ED8F2|nr:histidine kinase [Fulvivirga maritima]UII28810.1 histidine kinase [Fulvivirga maritima]